MKIAIVLSILLLFCVGGSYAAFPIKTSAVPFCALADSAASEVGHSDFPALTKWKRAPFSERIKIARQLYGQRDVHQAKGTKGNTLGVLSFVFATLSIFSFFAGVVVSGAVILLWPLLAIAAIVLGIIGCGKKYRGKGLAIAGLALGVLSIIGIPVAIILAFTGI